MTHKIAIIVGSLREGSINRKVARSICAIRGDNLDCSMIEIGDLPLYNQDLDVDPPRAMAAFSVRRSIAVPTESPFSPARNIIIAEFPVPWQNAIDVGSAPVRAKCLRQEARGNRYCIPWRHRRLRCQPSDSAGLRVPQHAGHAAARGLSRACHRRQFRPGRMPQGWAAEGPGDDACSRLPRLGRHDPALPATAGRRRSSHCAAGESQGTRLTLGDR